MNCLIAALVLMDLDNSKWYVHVQCTIICKLSSICNKGISKGLKKTLVVILDNWRIKCVEIPLMI